MLVSLLVYCFKAQALPGPSGRPGCGL